MSEVEDDIKEMMLPNEEILFIRLPAIDKKDAAQVGTYIQKGMRKELPGQIISEKATTPKIVTSSEDDLITQLERLGKLRDAGVLSDEEFEEKKKVILSKM